MGYYSLVMKVSLKILKFFLKQEEAVLWILQIEAVLPAEYFQRTALNYIGKKSVVSSSCWCGFQEKALLLNLSQINWFREANGSSWSVPGDCMYIPHIITWIYNPTVSERVLEILLCISALLNCIDAVVSVLEKAAVQFKDCLKDQISFKLISVLIHWRCTSQASDFDSLNCAWVCRLIFSGQLDFFLHPEETTVCIHLSLHLLCWLARFRVNQSVRQHLDLEVIYGGWIWERSQVES